MDARLIPDRLTSFSVRTSLLISTILLVTVPFSVHALSLTRGTATTLSGKLGTVDATYVNDQVSITGYLDNTGLVDPAPTAIPAKRIQYDLLNNTGNGNIFEFRVDYAPGTAVIGAADPEGFYDGAGTLQTYWGGLAYTELFDTGFGTYNYDGPNGSEWAIDYQSDHVTWRQLGNGFFPDTATGDTNFGFNPTFALYFDPSTPLGLQPALVSGFDTVGEPVSSSGQLLSAVVVPLPAAVWLFASGLLGLFGIVRKKAA